MGNYNIMEIYNPARTILNFYLQHTVKGWAETSKEESCLHGVYSLMKRAKTITNKCLLFIYLFLAVLGLPCSMGFLKLWRVDFSRCRAQALGQPGFSSCDAWAQ